MRFEFPLRLSYSDEEYDLKIETEKSRKRLTIEVTHETTHL